MQKIAITGNIASGKSAAEEFIKSQGFSVLDADDVTHELLNDSKTKKQINIELFGFDIFEGLEISRKKLAKVIFSNELLRKKLEAILHPKIKLIILRFFREKEEAGEKIAFVSVPLLYEAKFEDIFDKVIFIYADDATRLKRLIDRSDITEEDAIKRMQSQLPQEKKIGFADFVIYNDKSINDLNIEVDRVLKELF